MFFPGDIINATLQNIGGQGPMCGCICNCSRRNSIKYPISRNSSLITREPDISQGVLVMEHFRVYKTMYTLVKITQIRQMEDLKKKKTNRSSKMYSISLS